MKNKLHVIKGSVRLVCIWTQAGGSNGSLTCKWVEASKTQAVTAASSTTDEGRMQLCA
jgi:hypothetical protein